MVISIIASIKSDEYVLISISTAKQIDPTTVLIRLAVIVSSIFLDLRKSVTCADIVPVTNVSANGKAINKPL